MAVSSLHFVFSVVSVMSLSIVMAKRPNSPPGKELIMFVTLFLSRLCSLISTVLKTRSVFLEMVS